jgi:glycosyltransferase involved in cell wall biosynthesis
MVLHVLNSPTGGAALSTLGLIAELERRGIRSCAVCDTAGYEADQKVLSDAVEGRSLATKLYWTNRKIRSAPWKRPIHEVRQLLQTGFQRGSTGKVVESARRWGADLIHTNTIVTSEGALAARQLGLPHVWHVRELVGPGQPTRLPFEGAKFAPFMTRYCSKLIANSHACAALVRDIAPAGMLEVVPNGIDLSRFTPRGQYQRPGKIVVAMVASLTSRVKKHALFVEAAALVDRSLPIEWRIYGHDPSRGGTLPADAYIADIHARIAQAGLRDRFAWPGFVEDPRAIMSDIDLLVHPADEESFGRVVVEAMAAALPAVGVRGGGVGEIIRDGETGYLADPDNARQLATGIQRLVSNAELRRTMGLAGRQRAESTYSLEACATGVARVYEMAMLRPLAAATADASRAAVSS